MRAFLDVVPDELIGEPGRLPVGKRLVVMRFAMTDAEPRSAGFADHRRQHRSSRSRSASAP